MKQKFTQGIFICCSLLAGLNAQASSSSSAQSSLSQIAVVRPITEYLESSVASLSQADAFLKNDKIKIELPGRALKAAHKGAKMIGKGERFDKLILCMNGAASSVMPFAKAIVVETLRNLSASDLAKLALGGSENALNNIKSLADAPMRQAMRPQVKKALQEAQIATYYEKLPSNMRSLLKMESLEEHVVTGAIAGLFYSMQEKAKSISSLLP